MTFRIHFEHSDGSEDHIDIQGSTIEEIREKAEYEIAKRGGLNPWSEELE